MRTRRDFILQTAVAGGVLALQGAPVSSAAKELTRASKPLRVLILGATGFIGPHFVPAAVERGHKVSVFLRNRGPESADLLAGVERLMGDRNGDLESIKNRDWDAVLDLATYGPGWVRSLGEALKGRVKHYSFISTISVYDNPAAHDITDENSKVQTYHGSADPYSVTKPGEHYGAFKWLCEREAEQQFPGKTLILRPGYIVGPGDRNGAFTYWPVRMEKGGEVLVAGEPAAPVQFIDVRDLAAWAMHLIEGSVTGIYNAVGPAVPMTFEQMLNTGRSAMSVSPTLTWAPSSWLAAQKDPQTWQKLLFWTSEPGGFAGTMRMSIERALAKGFTTRPLAATMTDTLSWYRKQPADRQAGLLSIRKKKDDGTGWDVMTTPWPVYLELEKHMSSAWHASSVETK